MQPSFSQVVVPACDEGKRWLMREGDLVSAWANCEQPAWLLFYVGLCGEEAISPLRGLLEKLYDAADEKLREKRALWDTTISANVHTWSRRALDLINLGYLPGSKKKQPWPVERQAVKAAEYVAACLYQNYGPNPDRGLLDSLRRHFADIAPSSARGHTRNGQ